MNRWARCILRHRGAAAAWLAVVLVSPWVAQGVACDWGRPLRADTAGGLLWALAGSPWLEEWIYRRAVQAPVALVLASRLQAAWAGHAANAVAALVFVGVHWPAQGVGALAWLVPGAVLGELFRQTQRVWPCVLLHAWFNIGLWWHSHC